MPVIVNPSKYQQAIFDWCTSPTTGNLICNAVAGSGKSTVLRAIVTDYLPCTDSIAAITFAKANADTLSKIMPANCKCSTLHSFGLSTLKERFGKFKIEADKIKYILYDLYDRNLVWKAQASISKLISLAKAHVYNVEQLETNLYDLTNKYNIDIPTNGECEDFPAPFVDMLLATYKASLEDTKRIDFDDMLLLPVIHKLPLPHFDWALIDEAQDLNPVQISLVRMLAEAGARVIAVGDRKQAIYGFRGADIDSMDNIKLALNADELPLSICYRCAKAVVSFAQAIVPHIEAHHAAAEGSVININEEEFSSWVKESDMILCRTTAPLVTSCLHLIAQERKAFVLGRKFGDALISLIETISSKANLPIEAFTALAEHYFKMQVTKYSKKGQTQKVQDLYDKQETLFVLSHSCTTSADLISKITNIFREDAPGILHSTVHRAKGMESPTVFILRPDLLPHPMAKGAWELQQEEHIAYVAYTRAKEQLVLVNNKEPNQCHL